MEFGVTSYYVSVILIYSSLFTSALKVMSHLLPDKAMKKSEQFGTNLVFQDENVHSSFIWCTCTLFTKGLSGSICIYRRCCDGDCTAIRNLMSSLLAYYYVDIAASNFWSARCFVKLYIRYVCFFGGERLYRVRSN